jgi:hypothetical protein
MASKRTQSSGPKPKPAASQAPPPPAPTLSPAPRHLAWLVDTGVLQTADGKPVRVLELRHENDSGVLSAWAKHFRNQYCDDGQIEALRKGTGLSRADYLRTIKFPDQSEPPGPSIRSGDFGEVLVADYVEFALNYWLPRTRYDRKAVRNESTKGSDIIAFKLVAAGREDPNDVLALFEAKAQLTGNAANGRLNAAVVDSAKDELRKAESLNAIKQRLLDQKRFACVAVVERFQDPEDRPHREEYGAVAIVSTPLFDKNEIVSTNVSSHPHSAGLSLIVIHGQDLMALVHELYRRAADEA